MWRSRRADMHFSTVITPSWITQQMSVEKCVHQGASARRERQTLFKVVTWAKQTWKKHPNSRKSGTTAAPILSVPGISIPVINERGKSDVPLKWIFP